MRVNDQNGNSRVEPMEIVEMTVRVQNMGHGDARGVAADVQVGQNVFLAGDAQTHFNLGAIPTGKYRDFKFMFYTNNRIAGGEKIPIVVNLTEARPKFNAQKDPALAMNAELQPRRIPTRLEALKRALALARTIAPEARITALYVANDKHGPTAVSYTHLRAHETVLELVCRLLLEKKKMQPTLILFKFPILHVIYLFKISYTSLPYMHCSVYFSFDTTAIE